jgi:hypothetical protein
MNTFKRTWLFWLVVFLLPLLVIVMAGICGNEIGVHTIADKASLYFEGSFIHTLLVSVSTSLIAAGIVYLFIDKKLRELLAHDEVITVMLKADNGKEKACPPISRKDFSRQEVMGYLGMLGGPERFKLNFINTPEFGDRILKIQQGKGNSELVIKCTEDEFKQFSSDYRENDDITIILQLASDSSKRVEHPPMPRKNFCRAEVLGYIGMFSNVQHFEIKKLKSPQFLKDLSEISKSKGAQEFIIECTESEFKQFEGMV